MWVCHHGCVGVYDSVSCEVENKWQELTLHHKLQACGGWGSYTIISRALVKTSVSASHIVDGQEARFIFLSVFSHLHLRFSLWKTEWVQNEHQTAAIPQCTAHFSGGGALSSRWVDGKEDLSKTASGFEVGVELRGQRKIMARVEKPQSRRRRRGRVGWKRDTQYRQRVGSTSGGISRYRGHATLTNVPFSQAVVMKAIFLDLGRVWSRKQ